MDVSATRPAFHAFELNGTNEVYAYEEEGSGVRIVCKFYGPIFGWDRDRAAWMAPQEYSGCSTTSRSPTIVISWISSQGQQTLVGLDRLE